MVGGGIKLRSEYTNNNSAVKKKSYWVGASKANWYRDGVDRERILSTQILLGPSDCPSQSEQSGATKICRPIVTPFRRAPIRRLSAGNWVR